MKAQSTTSRRRRGYALAASCALSLAVLAGCGSRRQTVDTVPAYMPSAHVVLRLKRVVLVELDPREAPPELARDLSESIYKAVQDRQTFPVEFVPADKRADVPVPHCRGPRLSLEELANLRNSLGCDAVMVGSVSSFQPYPNAWLGVQLWLIDLRTGRTLWGVDHVWRTGDTATAKRMKHYFDAPDCEKSPDGYRLAEMSPRALGNFVAWDLSRSLPSPPGVQEPRPGRSTGRKVYDEAKKIFTN